MIHANTKNKSFLKMYYILKEMGIRNNTFFLQLYDETLYDIDPLDEEHLTEEQKLRVHIEISKNPWYYFREIVKIPMTDIKLDFELTRATLAIIWSLLNDLHSYIVIPRQCYKSYTVACFYSWLIYWGAKNFTGTFFAQNDSLVTQNLARVKDIRESLPKYLNLKSNNDTDNQHMLVYNAGDFKNTLITKAPGMNEEAANNVGRGNSTMGQWYDEFAFIPYIWVQYGAAIPAYSTVAKAAERNGSHHHIIITTTAGNKKTKTGAWAYDFLQNCAPFTELLYDKCYFDENDNCLGIKKEEVLDYIANNNTGQFFLRIEYSWHELSKPVNYLEEMKRLMSGLDEFNRGVLNIWSDSNADHPLGQERVQELVQTVVDPTKVVMVDNIYVLKYYRDPELCKSQSKCIVFGMDCGGNTRRDYSTLVGVDVTNSEVVCTLRVNQFSINRFARAVAYILLYLFPEATLVGERNYVGKPVLETITEIIGSSRVYKDKDDQPGVMLQHKLRNIMYGDVLRVSVIELGKYIHDNTIISEIAGLITDKNGRIDHNQNGGHDDLLIAYLYCRWFIMYCSTKRAYIDEIYFNSRIDNDMTIDQVNDAAEYSNDRSSYDYVMKDRGTAMNIEKAMKHRENSDDFVSMQIKRSMDLVNQSSHEEYDTNVFSMYEKYRSTKEIDEKDINVDVVAEEHKNEYHEYTEDLDKDDPVKVTKETKEIRDTSEDAPPNIFSFNFKIA